MSIKFEGELVAETPNARLLVSATGKEIWIPKSVFTYFSNDGQGCVKFSVEGWKQRAVQANDFDEE